MWSSNLRYMHRRSSSWLHVQSLHLRTLSTLRNGTSGSALTTNPLNKTISQPTIYPFSHDNACQTRNHSNTSNSAATRAPPNTNHRYPDLTFPSLIIRAQPPLQASGAFAESQALYLHPDPTAVQHITDWLTTTRTGIVAHYYMDVELQGVLQAVAQHLPGRVVIADSLHMGQAAVNMVHDYNVTTIVCLGVDFMSESVQALVGSTHTPVYRADARAIGCSLAESAEREAYPAWLRQASLHHNALHVVYINTSLETKATSSTIVPTITCTSSNVLATLLQAFVQMGPDLKLLYGPDTYMGQNLVTYLDTILASGWDDRRIQQQLHPQHTRQTLQQLRDAIDVFPQGNCVVHHMFGESVVQLVQEKYSDCYVTAHLEVPGEMFAIAMAKSLQDQGVVGSTSDILNFIKRKVQEAAAESSDATAPRRLRFILGTEAGMVTSIVQSVQSILRAAGDNGSHLEAEIIFPVAPEAYTATNDDNVNNLAIVPGVSASEGCSTAGGCATCPFMKMNSLDTLTDLLELIHTTQTSPDDTAAHKKLRAHLPPDRLRNKMLDGRPATEVGSEPIMYMREFMKTQRIPTELCQKVMKGRFDRALLYRA
jgi:quinolinate synthase